MDSTKINKKKHNIKKKSKKKSCEKVYNNIKRMEKEKGKIENDVINVTSYSRDTGNRTYFLMNRDDYGEDDRLDRWKAEASDMILLTMDGIEDVYS